MEYRILEGESIYDVAVKLYGDLVVGIEQLLLLNDLNLDANLQGVIVIYNVATRKKPIFVNQETEVTTFTYKTKSNQSVFDLAVQLNGDLSGLAEILTQYKNLDSKIPLETSFNLTISDDPISLYFSDRNVNIQTDIEGLFTTVPSFDDTDITFDSTIWTFDEI